MPAEQLPATANIMSFIRFIVGINVCKSRAQLAPCEFASKYRLFFCTAYLQAYNEVQRRGSFEWCIEDVGFFHSCKSLLELWDADLWNGQPSWWLQHTQILGLTASGTEWRLPQVCWDLFSEKRMCVLYTRLWSSGLYHCACQQNKHLDLLKLLQLLWGFFFSSGSYWSTSVKHLWSEPL